jgi:hypothetical protein
MEARMTHDHNITPIHAAEILHGHTVQLCTRSTVHLGDGKREICVVDLEISLVDLYPLIAKAAMAKTGRARLMGPAITAKVQAGSRGVYDLHNNLIHPGRAQ